MATKKGVWNLQQVRDKQLQDLWSYTGVSSLFTWGFNTNGQLGHNDRTARSSPIQVASAASLWQYVSHCGDMNDGDHHFFTREDGTMWAVGGNTKGQLGQNNEIKYSSPVQVPGTTWGPQMSVISTKSYAIKTDGTLWAWGNNSPSYGELGHNNKTNYSSPAQIPGTTWSKVTSYGYSVIATKTDGTLWTWGANNFGKLGLNNTNNYSSPKQVPGTTWTGDIGGGNQFAAAIRTDGTLWMWGVNENGQLGQNGPHNTNYSSPKQVGSDTTWSKVEGHVNSIVAIKTDGTLWAWGYNDSGNLGQNNTTKISSPVQIPGTTWSNLATGNQWTIATKTDGTLWGWGTNNQGQLGQNNSDGEYGYSSPVQIGDSSWNTGDREFGTSWLGAAATKQL